MERTQGRVNFLARSWVLEADRVGCKISRDSDGIGLGHSNNGKSGAVAERHFDTFEDLIAALEIQRNAGERGTHFETREASGAGGGFASFENSRAQAAACPIRVNEEGANFGCVGCRIEKFWFANWRMVTAEQSLAIAPAAASDDDPSARRLRFGDEIGFICYKLRIQSQHSAKCAIDLFERVVIFL